jgi:hypothetical protein
VIRRYPAVIRLNSLWCGFAVVQTGRVSGPWRLRFASTRCSRNHWLRPSAFALFDKGTSGHLASNLIQLAKTTMRKHKPVLVFLSRLMFDISQHFFLQSCIFAAHRPSGGQLTGKRQKTKDEQ